MLPKAYRLSDHEDIHRVFRLGKKAYGSLFSFVSLANSLEKSRFAIVVSKKTVPRAVDRNRVKRLVREAIRLHLSALDPGYDVVVVLLKKIPGKLGLSTVSSDIDALLHRTQLVTRQSEHTQHDT